MDRYEDSWMNRRRRAPATAAFVLCLLCVCCEFVGTVSAGNNVLTACQHLRGAESRRAKALGDTTATAVRIPKCSRVGDFEPIQCSNDVLNSDCWCVDEYGIEIMGTRRNQSDDVNCAAPTTCSASSCRMYCPSGFARDLRSGCPICQCRDPCAGVQCPGGQACQPQEVQCIAEPCPPIPTCKRARGLTDLCPAGQPMTIAGTIRPFLCGNDPGKPTCPPLYRCLVQSNNDYGVCCPASVKFEKPGECPPAETMHMSEAAGPMCGTPCGVDLECPQMQKCCSTAGCHRNCQQPFNVTACHQAKMLSEILSVSEREGKGYIPQCDGPGGIFDKRQCSRNGLVCWCVDPITGNKVKGTMGAAQSVFCDDIENVIARSIGRGVDSPPQCDQNICAAVCEYGFKIDHNGCPTCECSEPCEGFLCPMGSHCEVATDPNCSYTSSMCASEPICKPNLVYSNPCDIGTPLADNKTGEVFLCHQDKEQKRTFDTQEAFFDVNTEESGRAMTNTIICPDDFSCVRLHKEAGSVCCALDLQQATSVDETAFERQQTMCEYLRDFSDRMEGTEDGMALALPAPQCDTEGYYEATQCVTRKVKVTRTEQKRILEQTNVRRMRAMVEQRTKRSSSASDEAITNLRLIAKDEAHTRQDIVDLVRSRVLQPTVSSGEFFYAEVEEGGISGRNAKLIEITVPRTQTLDNEADSRKSSLSDERKTKRPTDELVEVEVEECWCVDGFGTEIPRSRGTNHTDGDCKILRESLECLDITCRMGCDYGFVLDPITQCPSCECRDPCDAVECPESHECRSVEVSCEGEYCPPVPACLPRKPGQCPFLVPPGSDDTSSDSCEYECRADAHCDGKKRCCSNGCGTQCVEPQLKTACQHLQSIQLHQATELGIPARQKYIVQCDEQTGHWKSVQCGPNDLCWCVDERGNEKSGTRMQSGGKPNCDVQQKSECPLRKCKPCEHGYQFDQAGCQTCDCRDPCTEISCPNGEMCELVKIECVDEPCPKMPICIPQRVTQCSEGEPFQLNGREVACGPQGGSDICPTTHTCQLNPMTNKGVCCTKTRDVCFESIDSSCLRLPKSANISEELTTKWRFNPRLNKCIAVSIVKSESQCQGKNQFHNEISCTAVCPVLSQCERLRMKNTMAAQRTGQTQAWFQPRCDDAGGWSPVQCLGGMESESAALETNAVGVCWCADKKGAPMKGSLTRGIEPHCTHRQARRRMGSEGAADLVMEELIRQMTAMADAAQDAEIENSLYDDREDVKQIAARGSVTERILEMVSNREGKSAPVAVRRLVTTTSRCNALRKSAPFPVSCNEGGAFKPTQCNEQETECWCVDEAGNQLPQTDTFERGTVDCVPTPIDSVYAELHLSNPEQKTFSNIYDTVRVELTELLGDMPDNLRVQDSSDGHVLVKFELTDNNKIDTAFALEEFVKLNRLALLNGELRPDITLSRFVHKNTVLPQPQPASGGPETALQTFVFVLATASAFLVSILVVFVMLKRGKNKMHKYPNKNASMGDKFLDYSSPIFVLSANDKVKDTTNRGCDPDNQ